ncbi:ATP-binding protein [Phytomonospora endophytica]|uniref:Transcriptional regulator with XRE-family HTH domain/tetratricopeptide (TPR) repeat protein n=1 Tax=Phytomonospora endophytica TaxID=714109 RepID=A0A841FN77_9ACTN|nr:helix-turn-helix domain-containing protein [Phytomonospora endophytica]MBB6034059.1 transcriptional regulator with XRE-family HTH domain/tetratricopeptide (TPR) repeat protein [Phytomonospora endophytica]
MPEGAFDTTGGLRRLRLRAAMTQEELAAKAGIGTRTVRDVESGKVRPQPRTVRLLAAALGLGETDGPLLGTPERVAVVPRELPRALGAFAGREADVAALLDAVDDGATAVAVHGMAGVGKTSLAVWTAHALAGRYPDGQLFVDLHGFTNSLAPRPGARTVLTRVLRALGVPDGDIPADLDELTARYRSVIAERRVLLVFDNALGAEQVEALLPGTPDSLVLATSRRDMSLLTGAYSVNLEPPDEASAAAMLTAAVPGRIGDAEAALLAERCGRLPLAMGLAAARLRSRPGWRVEDLLARFADQGRLLDELDMGHRGVTAGLRASYLELDTAHRRLFRRLGLVPGDDLDAHAAGALCEEGPERATAMMESLVDAHLAETRAPGRYRMHDLVRLFATRLMALEETGGDGALLRLLDVYLHFAYRAVARVTPSSALFADGAAAFDAGLPGFTEQDDAVSWFHTERRNLQGAVAAAFRAGHFDRAWHLATAFNGFFIYDRDRAAHAALNDVALDSARRIGDGLKEAYALGDAGRQLGAEGRHREAIVQLQRSVALKREHGETGAAALTLTNVAVLHRRSGRFADAVETYAAALALAADAPDAVVVLISVNMVVPLLRLGRFADAGHRLAEAERRLEADDEHTRTRIEGFRGNLARELGDPATALALHTACLDDCRRERIDAGVIMTLIELAEDLRRLGRDTEAVDGLTMAVACVLETGDPSMERAARNSLGTALTAAGRPGEAVGHHERAAALAESQEDAYELARAEHGLGEAHCLLGDVATGRVHLLRAAAGYTTCGVPEAETVAERLAAL